MGLSDIRAKIDHRIYKIESTAQQRDEACKFAEAIYHNSRIEDAMDWEYKEKCNKAKFKLLVEIERSALMLILERDSK